MNVKIINIGNSKGIRLPKKIIEKYHFSDELILEAREDCIVLKSKTGDGLSSWEDTFKEMAAELEEWSDFDHLSDDGLD